jgi:nucleoside-diphosphate-sugar epimerase
MNQRVAITGVTGFIGRRLAAHFISRGVEVVAIVRPESRRQAPEGVTTVAAPLERTALTAALGRIPGIHAVVHLAGVVSSVRDEDYRTVNVDGTQAVAAAARSIGARLVHVSSLAAAGAASAAQPISEDDPPHPLNAYGRSKLESEAVVAAVDGLNWTILRPGVVYGPGDRALLPLFRLAARGVAPLIGRPDAAYTFVHVRDLVRIIDVAAGSARHGDTLFVGHAEPVTPRGLIEGIREALGRSVMILPVPDAALKTLARVGDIAGRLSGRTLPMNGRRYAEMSAEGFVCRVDRLRERLGVEAAIGLRDGLKETASWYREHGWL